jgi:hypothetical protein
MVVADVRTRFISCDVLREAIRLTCAWVNKRYAGVSPAASIDIFFALIDYMVLLPLQAKWLTRTVG